jgi:predicted ATPase
LVVTGSPGIGKTRFVEEFLSGAEIDKATVLRGGSSLAEGMPPYLPFLESLGDYAARTPTAVLVNQIGAQAPILWTLLPDLATRLKTRVPDASGLPEQNRFRLFEAVTSWLAAIAVDQPLILFLDDLHWADAATLDLLLHVSGRLHKRPVLVVGAYREGEAAENGPAQRTVAELDRRRLADVLRLQPLTSDDTALLAAGLLGGPIERRAADAVHWRSEGNTFFAEEIMRGLVEEGSLAWDGRRWLLDTSREMLLPRRVAEAIRTRLARLDPAIPDLLRTAAVVGRGLRSSVARARGWARTVGRRRPSPGSGENSAPSSAAGRYVSLQPRSRA